MDIATAQEFATFTKGLCYLLGGGFVVAFIFFWLFLTEREKKQG